MPLTVPAHPVFPRLLAPDDAELADQLGAAVVHRETVHSWPLSWVERVRLADGRTYACKTQLPPTVEPEFYARARSPLLPAYVQVTAGTIALDWIEAPLLATVRDTGELLAHGRAVVGEIARLPADLPTYLDIAGEAAWRNEVEWALDVRAMKAASRSVRDGRAGSGPSSMKQEPTECAPMSASIWIHRSAIPTSLNCALV